MSGFATYGEAVVAMIDKYLDARKACLISELAGLREYSAYEREREIAEGARGELVEMLNRIWPKS